MAVLNQEELLRSLLASVEETNAVKRELAQMTQEVLNKERELISLRKDQESLKMEMIDPQLDYPRSDDTFVDTGCSCAELKTNLERLQKSTAQQEADYLAIIEQLENDKQSLSVTIDIYNAKLISQTREEKTKLDAAAAKEMELVNQCAAKDRELEQLKSTQNALGIRLEDLEFFSREATEELVTPLGNLAGVGSGSRPFRGSTRGPDSSGVTQVWSEREGDFANRTPMGFAPSTQAHAEAQEGVEAYSQAYIPWSRARQMVLNAFATISVPQFSLDSYIFFSRDELMKKLGSSMSTSVDGIFTRKKPMAIKHNLNGCIWADARNINPWLPSVPGQHGYMFYGVKGRKKDNTKFLRPTARALFIAENRGEWRYFGLYEIHRQPENDLTKDEWIALPDAFKDGDDGFCSSVLSKMLGKDGAEKLIRDNREQYDERVADIRLQYDSGQRRVPCVVLKCISYNQRLVSDLLSSRPPEESHAPLGKRKRASSSQEPADDSD